MPLTPLILFALTAASILVAGLVGSTRRSGFWITLIVSIFLTPIVGFALAVLSGSRRWPGRARRLRRPRWLRSDKPEDP